ncbi:patatin-like phospholipase domain-containing protein 2 isoform X1 [Patella vulgata]|uniref:patatin-like phospholipase domain-containing protein 2 isoform X1 n=1 Tax=Patella vulgata TaxID=6465 RepID=UPI0021806159|nr:patatin-like phospholipase domain-containing protein 2 isoform X1 [Patella vulgata]
MNLSFSGCGFLGIYHIGVASCFKEHAPQIVESCKFAGASAGAIVSCCLMCGCCLGECTNFTLRLATKARSRTLGPLHPSFNINKILREALRQVLPSNAHELATGRLFISLTRVSDKQAVIVSEYESKEELIQALLCSSFVPFYSGLIPPKFRGERYVDGGLSDNLPILDEHTVTVAPFAGESDICPKDLSSNFLHINIVNTSMQCSAKNLYRMSHALFPPDPEELSNMCRQGFDDTLVYLQQNNLISCIRHLTVRSSITTKSLLEDGASEDVNESVMAHHNHNEEDCPECKKKLQVALLDSLPPSVVSALQTACDSVNNGLINYFFSTRPVRLLSIAVTPWMLPIDIIYNYGVKFLEWLPSMPQDIQAMFRELSEIIQELITQFLHQRHSYSARFTCQLAITEVKCEKEKRRKLVKKRKASEIGPMIRNYNIGFAVDFNTQEKDTMGSLQSLEGHIDKISMEDIHFEQRDEAGSLSYYPNSEKPSQTNGAPCQQLFDTFEQCLHVTNHLDSVLSYHYQDPNNKGCYKFAEIYSLKGVPINIPETDTDTSQTTASDMDLSWDSYVEMKPEIEDEIEAFIDSAMCLPEFDSDSYNQE